MKLIDSHIHIDQLPNSLESIAPLSGYQALVPGIRPRDTLRWLEQASKLPFSTWSAAALHPWETLQQPLPQDSPDATLLESLARDSRIQAIGETGLDKIKADTPTHAAQMLAWFEWHVRLACQVEKPLVIHSVQSNAGVLDVLRRYRPAAGGIIHAFAGSREEAEQFDQLGFLLGIGPSVTRPRSRRVRNIASTGAEHQLVLETDAPYMQVEASQGPVDDLLRIATEVGGLRCVDFENVAAFTTANMQGLFGGKS